MSYQFGRSWKVSVDDLVTEDLRVQFRITKTLEKEPNTCEVTITNLSPASRRKMKAKGMAVTVEAGYSDESRGSRGVIFSGDSRLCDHREMGPDVHTQVNCGDGESVYQYARVAKSFSEDYPVENVIRYVADKLRVNTGNLDDVLKRVKLPISKFSHGYTVQGTASQAFDRLMKSMGLTWSVQQGAIQVLVKGENLPQEAIVVSSDSGLLGSPEHTPPTKEKKQSYLTCKMLLNHRVRPGGLIRMDAKNVKGDFVVHKCEHSGDSHGNHWMTTVEAYASKNKLVTL